MKKRRAAVKKQEAAVANACCRLGQFIGGMDAA